MKTQLTTSGCLALSLIVTACAEQGRAPDPSVKANVDEAKRNAIFKQYFPKDIESKPHEGFAAIRCRVLITGRLSNCVTVFEEPAGAGFAAATLKASSKFTMHPAMRDGRPIEGLVTIPIHWKLTPPEARKATSPDHTPETAPSSNP